MVVRAEYSHTTKYTSLNSCKLCVKALKEHMTFSLPLTEPAAARGRQLPEKKREGHREEGWDDEEWEVRPVAPAIEMTDKIGVLGYTPLFNGGCQYKLSTHWFVYFCSLH